MPTDLNQYETVPSVQKKLYDDGGKHSGYRVTVSLEKDGVQKTASRDVWTTPEKASDLESGPNDEFTAWYKARLDEYQLVDEVVAQFP